MVVVRQTLFNWKSDGDISQADRKKAVMVSLEQLLSNSPQLKGAEIVEHKAEALPARLKAAYLNALTFYFDRLQDEIDFNDDPNHISFRDVFQKHRADGTNIIVYETAKLALNPEPDFGS